MAQPLYFLPNMTRAQLAPRSVLSRAILQERGLAEVFADVEYQDCLLGDSQNLGPGKKSGMYLCYQSATTGETARRTAYYPDEQDWHAVGDGSGLWIGLDKSSPPTPEDLVRKNPHSGYTVQLGDGARWAVPIIRRPDDSTDLPRDLLFGADGKLEQTIKRTYQSYWDESAEVAEWLFNEDGFSRKSFSLEKALHLAVRALSLNYRFGRAEQNVLRLIDSTNWERVLWATVDMWGTMDTLKKNVSRRSEPASTSPGQPDDCQATGPAEETCS